MRTIKKLLTEALRKQDIASLLLDMGYLTTFNVTKINQIAKDGEADKELTQMLKFLNGQKVVNGMRWSELADNSDIYIKDPNKLSIVLQQIMKTINYMEPRIRTLTKDSEMKTNIMKKIESIKTRYLEAIK